MVSSGCEARTPATPPTHPLKKDRKSMTARATLRNDDRRLLLPQILRVCVAAAAPLSLPDAVTTSFLRYSCGVLFACCDAVECACHWAPSASAVDAVVVLLLLLLFLLRLLLFHIFLLLLLLSPLLPPPPLHPRLNCCRPTVDAWMQWFCLARRLLISVFSSPPSSFFFASRKYLVLEYSSTIWYYSIAIVLFSASRK